MTAGVAALAPPAKCETKASTRRARDTPVASTPHLIALAPTDASELAFSGRCDACIAARQGHENVPSSPAGRAGRGLSLRQAFQRCERRRGVRRRRTTTQPSHAAPGTKITSPAQGALMRCPRCTLTELPGATDSCWLCGYSAAVATAVEAPPPPPLPSPTPNELDARRELVRDFAMAGLLDAAPDGARASEPAAGADQRALAAVAHQCLTGVPMGNGPPSAKDGFPGLPLHVSQALRRALSSRPADRFPNVIDFVAALGGTRPDARPAWFGANPRKKGPGSPVVIVDADADPAAKHLGGRLAAATAGLLVALGGGAAWLGLSSIPASPAR